MTSPVVQVKIKRDSHILQFNTIIQNNLRMPAKDEIISPAFLCLEIELRLPEINLIVAGVAGLEPVTSAVTGQRSNQLSYTPAWGKETLKKIFADVKICLEKF